MLTLPIIDYDNALQCGRNSGGSAKGSKGGSRKAGGGAPQTQAEFDEQALDFAKKNQGTITIDEITEKLGVPRDKVKSFVQGALERDEFRPAMTINDFVLKGRGSAQDFMAIQDRAEALGFRRWSNTDEVTYGLSVVGF